MKRQNETPIVSIVTPSYNQGQFIEDTIKSVLSQEGNFYIDYIIMDGGSEDNSVEIIKKYEQLLKDGRWTIRCKSIKYRWLSKKDSGQSDAVNRGWAMAEGEILGWLNSDDTLLPEALKEVVDLFTQNPDTAVVYGEGYFVDEDGSVISRFNTKHFDRELLQEIDYIPQPAVFLHKRVLNRIGMLDESLHYCMDYDLWIRASREFDFTYINKYLASFKIHKESKSMSKWINAAKEEIMLLKRHFIIVRPPAIYRYAKALFMSNTKLSLLFATPLILFVTFFKYIQINKRLPLYPLRKWIDWIKQMYMSNKQGLDFHIWD